MGNVKEPFDNIIHHEKLKKMFIRAIKDDNLSSFYIFYGIDGIGKFTFANEILNTRSNFEDNLIIKKDPSTVLVDTIRNICNFVSIKPKNSRVIIVDINSSITISAENAFLKTLEEIKPHTTIILITNDLSILSGTLLSRAIKIKFNDIPIDKIYSFLKNVKGFDDESSKIASLYSFGSMSLALKNVKNKEILTFAKDIINFLLSMHKKSEYECLYFANFIHRGSDIDFTFNIIQNFYLDLIRLNLGCEIKYKDYLENLKEYLKNYNSENFKTYILKINLCLEKNFNFIKNSIVIKSSFQNLILDIKK